MKSLLKFLFLFPVLFFCIGFGLQSISTPVFDSSLLRSIAEEAVRLHPPYIPHHNSTLTEYDFQAHNQALNAVISHIHEQLYHHYPAHIISPAAVKNNPSPWLTNLAGGFKTQMLLMHASLSEYVMIWGSQLETTGHSGRNWAEFHDYLISGQGVWWGEGKLNVKKANPGVYIYTEPFSGGIVHLSRGTFMLEYCHGVIPALLPFGLADSLISSLDPVTIWKSMRAYGEMTIKELLVNKKV
jgi:hypothetical protein